MKSSLEHVEYAASKAGRNGQGDVRARAVTSARSLSLGEDRARRSFGTAGDHDDRWIGKAAKRCSVWQRKRRIHSADRKGCAETAGAALALGCRVGPGICVCIGLRSSSVHRRVIVMPLMLMRRGCARVRTMMTERATGLYRRRETLERERQHQ